MRGSWGAHFTNVVDRVELWRYATVYAQKLLVHDRGERQRAERLDACVVHAFRVLVLALGLEGEVVGQMAALVVSAEKEERVWVANLETP